MTFEEWRAAKAEELGTVPEAIYVNLGTKVAFTVYPGRWEGNEPVVKDTFELQEIVIDPPFPSWVWITGEYGTTDAGTTPMFLSEALAALDSYRQKILESAAPAKSESR